jgi:hypothetical protein
MLLRSKGFAVSLYALLAFSLTGGITAYGADDTNRNLPERVEWFRDAGFGLFITWGFDVQLGSVISHSMVGASEDYLKRFEDLPKSFDPKKFDPDDWAVLAKLAGIKYVVFVAKHHSGFCMFDTATTNFSVMNTRYGKDITARVIDAFREQGIAVGYLFSPDDFHWLHEHGKLIDRNRPEVAPSQNPGLMDYDKAQASGATHAIRSDRRTFLGWPTGRLEGAGLGSPTKYRGDAWCHGNARTIHSGKAN